MGLLTQLILLCFCTFISASRVPNDVNPDHSRNHQRLPQQYSLFPGMFRTHYPEDFEYDIFYDNFFNWHKTNPNKGQNYQYPYLDNFHNHNHNHKPTTETTTTEQFTDNTVNDKVPEAFLQPPEEVTIRDNNESHKEEIDVNSQDKAKEHEDHKDSDKSADITSDPKLKTNISYMRQTPTKDDISKSSEHNAINIGQMDTIVLPVGRMIMPVTSTQSLNQEPPVLNPVVSNNPAGNIHGVPAPILVVNNEPVNVNDDFRPAVPQAVPLNIPQNPVNNVQPNNYNIASVPNNAMINNVPNSYYLVSNNQAIPLHNSFQTQTPSQMYALVPISNLGSNVNTNGNFVNQQNQNHEVSNPTSNVVPYNNQRDNLYLNQPNNYVPLISQPNYAPLNNQQVNFVPLNNQGNQYVSNQPNNLVRFNQPDNMVSVNNNPPSNMLPVGNQPNYVVLNNPPNNMLPVGNQPNYVVLNNPPNNMFTVSNQPNNVFAVNSGGNIPFIVQAQSQPNIVLYSMKDENEEADSEEKDEEMEGKLNDHDNIHPSEEPIEVVDA